jgi:hypothetical protein
MPSGERNDPGSDLAAAGKAAPHARAISRQMPASLNARERTMLMDLLNEMR